MAGNELIAGIAGLGNLIGGFASERHKLRLEKEEKKERNAATEAAAAQLKKQNIFEEARIDNQKAQIDATADWRKSQASIAALRAQADLLKSSGSDVKSMRSLAEKYADLMTATGSNWFDSFDQFMVHNGMVKGDSGQWSPSTMPGMAPGGPTQPGNAPAGVNGQAPQISNQQAPAMSALGSGRIPSPVQTPQLQMGQAAPPQQGQVAPVQGQPGVQQPGPQVLRPGTVGPDTKLGSGIELNQANAQDARDRNALIKKQIEHTESETETVNNNRRIQKLELEGNLKKQQQAIRASDDKHRISKQQELLNSAKYDDEVAIGKLHSTQAQIALDLKSTTEKIAKEKAQIDALDIEIKKGTLTGFTPTSASTGRKEAEEAGKDLDKLAKARVETEGAAAYLWGLKSRNGVEIPNPKNDKGTQASNNLIKKPNDLDTNYKATLGRLSEINDRWYQALYHESEGEYLNAMGTTHVSDGGGPKDKETKASQANARSRYESAKKEYLALQAAKDKARKSSAKPSAVLDPTKLPNFTMEHKHFTNGNTKHGPKKRTKAANDYLKSIGH